jgi:hypothetical protein
LNSEIEIFRTGRFRSIDGRTLSFGAGDLAATAAAYDPQLHKAPHVVGHPKMDAPAYGWVTSLQHKGDRLVANIDQCDPAFADLVKAGRYGAVSAAFYDPDDDANPVPGAYYLRHVGWLGATPPAVKGLKQAQFAGADKYIAFGEDAPAVAERGFLSRLRGMIRAEVSRAVDPAAAIPLIEEFDDMNSTAFAEQQRQLTEGAAKLARDTEALAAREAAVTGKETAFSEQERVRLVAGDTAIIEQLEKSGQSIPAWRPVLLAFCARMHAAPVIAFGEGADKIEQPLVEAFHDFLGRLPKVVEFGEIARTPIEVARRPVMQLPVPKGYGVDQDEMAQRDAIMAFAEANKIDFAEAALRLAASADA